MWTAWEFDPPIVAGIGALGLVYGLSAGPWRSRLRDSLPLRRGQARNFLAGLLVLWFFLQSPVDRIGDDFLFSLHMLQHLAIVLVVPILLLRGTPGWMLRPLVVGPLAPLVRLVCRPLMAFALFNLTFAVAHIPDFFEPLNSNEALHAIEHLVYLGVATIMWIPVVGPREELLIRSYPARIGYLFLQTLPYSIVAAFVALSTSPWYQRYALAPRLTSLTPLQDQQVAGLLMWVGTNLYFFGAMAVLFFVWAAHEERLPSAAIAGQRGA